MKNLYISTLKFCGVLKSTKGCLVEMWWLDYLGFIRPFQSYQDDGRVKMKGSVQ